MNEVLEYLKDCGTFYIATCEGSQPRVRPFGAVCAFEGKLYIVTNNQKKVYRQLKENGKVELCGMRDGTWIRVEGEVVEDLRREARAAMMDANAAGLSSLYTVDDNLMTVFRFTTAPPPFIPSRRSPSYTTSKGCKSPQAVACGLFAPGESHVYVSNRLHGGSARHLPPDGSGILSPAWTLLPRLRKLLLELPMTGMRMVCWSSPAAGQKGKGRGRRPKAAQSPA